MIVKSSLSLPESPNTAKMVSTCSLSKGPIQSRAEEDSEDGRKNEMCKEPALTNDAVVVGRRHVGDGDRHEARAEVEVGDQGLED